MKNQQKSKVLGLDIGVKRIGVAVSDISQSIVFPRETIKYKKFSDALSKIKKICDDEKIGLLVIGLPLDEEDRETHITKFVRKCAEKLEKEIGIAIAFIDEAFSTEEGIAMMEKYDEENRDAFAAMLILERYLRET